MPADKSNDKGTNAKVPNKNNNQIPLNNTMTSLDKMAPITSYMGPLPVLGAEPVNHLKPLFNRQHRPLNDSIFALACNYPKVFYQRFVGMLLWFLSLRISSGAFLILPRPVGGDFIGSLSPFLRHLCLKTVFIAIRGKTRLFYLARKS